MVKGLLATRLKTDCSRRIRKCHPRAVRIDRSFDTSVQEQKRRYIFWCLIHLRVAAFSKFWHFLNLRVSVPLSWESKVGFHFPFYVKLVFLFPVLLGNACRTESLVLDPNWNSCRLKTAWLTETIGSLRLWVISGGCLTSVFLPIKQMIFPLSHYDQVHSAQKSRIKMYSWVY